ncbi:hypothetical protein P3T76_011460 [Phytophthora citrophthora]|uniref:Uncharacterized protein n=1 Tax=Phytophthora citrophthora TaxID=4793 RepID=A0AAD9G9G5_9STRA|nr:hypothetical protein P3T76_011460 [Phytophthora citrophthora]
MTAKLLSPSLTESQQPDGVRAASQETEKLHEGVWVQVVAYSEEIFVSCSMTVPSSDMVHVTKDAEEFVELTVDYVGPVAGD